MTGELIAIGNGLMVSNNAKIDVHYDFIDTPSGRSKVTHRVIDVLDPFGAINKGDSIDVAFRAEDGNKFSYRGKVIRHNENRCIIELGELTEEYNNIIRRAKEWQHQG